MVRIKNSAADDILKYHCQFEMQNGTNNRIGLSLAGHYLLENVAIIQREEPEGIVSYRLYSDDLRELREKVENEITFWPFAQQLDDLYGRE
ncbi:MAG TPA: hypothetical protein DCY27_04240 [Desulfobacterales bacterium]|nr:hypothetical protein [Desulfobacterales bacterium]